MKISKNSELLSSVYGRIDGLILAIPLQIKNFPYESYFRELIEVFGTDKEILLFYPKAENDKQAEEFSEILNSLQKPMLYFIASGVKQLNPWTRDAFLSLKTADKRTLLLTTCSQPQNRYLAGELIKVKENISWQSVNLNLTGGNILKADQYALFGNANANKDIDVLKSCLGDIDYIPIVSDYKMSGFRAEGKTTSDGFINFYSAFDRHQGIFHIDLFITLAGAENGIEYILIAEPVLGFIPNDDTAADLLEFANLIINETAKVINSIISNLEKNTQRKFTVIRNPMPLIVFEEFRYDLGKWQRNWNWASFNNCLVEIYNRDSKKIKNVWLPNYKVAGMGISLLPTFTIQNKFIFEALGFSVFQMKNDYSLLANMRGSLHCITNIIYRID